MVGNLGESHSGEAAVVNPVLPHQHGDGVGVGVGGAVGGSEDMLGGDQSASTEGVAATRRDQGHLPGILVDLRLLSPHDPVALVSQPAGAGPGGCCGRGCRYTPSAPSPSVRLLGGGGLRGGGSGGGEISLLNINVAPESPGSA